MSNNLFGNVIRVQAKTIAQDLVEVVPMGADVNLIRKITQETEIQNRNIRIDNILNDCDNQELDIKDHEDYKKATKNSGSSGYLFYMDYTYNDNTPKKP